MFSNQRRLRIIGLTMSALAVIVLGYELYRKLDYVTACHARLAQLELIGVQAGKNEVALDVREKALDAAEAQLKGVKQ